MAKKDNKKGNKSSNKPKSSSAASSSKETPKNTAPAKEASAKPAKEEKVVSKTAEAPAKKAESKTDSSVTMKKISLMASMDWSMRHAMRAFMDYLDPTLNYKGKKYKLQLDRIMAKPLKCGSDIRHEADLVVDRTIHWNDYYKCWAQQALDCEMAIVNHAHTFGNLDKHSTYDMMARAIHPDDHFPTTVLLPQFSAFTYDQKMKDKWEYEQSLIINNTEHGWDPHRRETNWTKVQEKMKDYDYHMELNEMLRQHFYVAENWLEKCVEEHYGNKFPIFLKKQSGGGGSDVFKVNSLEELYEKYDQTEGRAFHLQEAVEDYDVFIRCMGIGPQVLPMEFLPESPLHEHYSPEKLKVDKKMFDRLYHYVLFINGYHRWTYNSYESIIKNGKIHPIDFANACPDSNFTSLHVHFPWLICALVRWFSFCAVTGKDMGIDLEHTKYVRILNDPNKSQLEKYTEVTKLAEGYFEIDAFNKFCEENFKDLDDKMVKFYDEGHFKPIIEQAIIMSSFPKFEHERFVNEYSDMMANRWRPNAKEYLTTVVYK